MANPKQNDPTVQIDEAARAEKVRSGAAAELARVTDEATRPRSAVKEKLEADLAEQPRNLTEAVLRDHLNTRLQDLGQTPEKAREIANIRAAQMTGFDAPPAK